MPTLKSLQEEIDLIKDEIGRTLKSRSRTWLIAGVVGFLILAALILTVLRQKPDNSKVDALQRELEAEKARVKVLEEKLPLYDSLVANQQRLLDQNRKTETKIIHHYEKIPSTVRDLSREQLRREVTNY